MKVCCRLEISKPTSSVTEIEYSRLECTLSSPSIAQYMATTKVFVSYRRQEIGNYVESYQL